MADKRLSNDLPKEVEVEHSPEHKEYLRDRDLLKDHEAAQEQAIHMGHLSEEELAVEKKLRRRIDSMIMPLVILVYLMNYIDRCVSSLLAKFGVLMLICDTETTTLQHVYRAWKMTLDWSVISMKSVFRFSSSDIS